MELERTISTMQKNIEVLQQNTQVISKGFNILSGRVNKVTGDYELVNGKLEDYRKTFDEKITATEQNVSLALIALKLQTTSEIEEIKKTSLEAIGNATATNTTEARHPVDNAELCEKYIQNVTLKMEDWQRTAANETKLVAEMVKALAEISQGEKLKLENLSNYSRRELEKLGDILEKQGVEHSHEWDAITTKVKALRMEVEERDKKFTSDILDVHSYLRNTSKHCEEEVKKVEESLLEQNMAHNMAHENIALKIDEMTTALEQKPSMDPSYLRRLSGTEANITTLFAANKQFLQQFSAMEEMSGLVLSKIADLRTVHKNDNATTKKEVFEVQRSVTKLEHDSRVILDRVRDLQSKVDQSRDLQMDIGRLGDIEVETPKPTEVSIALQVEIGEMKDRIVTFEENVAELWRSHKQITDMLQHNGDMVTALQTAHLADHEDVSLQIMEIKIASKLLSEVIRNLSKNMSEFESRVESSNSKSEYSIGYSNFSSRLGEAAAVAAPPEKLETGSLNIDCRAMEDDINNLWELSRNISKAQELFLVKLLEMDMAEQAKMREELLNIKDRLASAEENYNALWKASRHMEKGQDEIQNSMDNIVLVHKTEAKNLTSDMSNSKQKLDNISTALAGLNDRVSNLELFSDMDSSRESSQLNSTELGKIKGRLAAAERDIQELWKSSEILSFQQQVFNEKVRDVQTVHENDTMSASIERMRNQLETQSLHLVVGNMTSRLQTVEKYTSPPYESKTIEFEINNWNEALADGLKNQQVVYEIGSLLDLPSSWRTFVERSGNYISLYNSLVKSEKPVYNEFTVEILDSDGRVYSTCKKNCFLLNS
ncbi:unnamed protein product [Orchesella dallaii]|uniref:Uncharacterized protein n=1 Tax=Orchesella dallaii TaxID=48710 RepID=A0ABP1RBQ6_9HEXA